ncbi:MAG: hypothetical protein GKS02_12540 [Alphaproteobacteria bacterium]|nr:hypothetical protein [Alphaproteobacteria bacterium]
MTDDGNLGGYRPDDPRYGLSGQALQDYYLARPTHFFIRAFYKPDCLDLRSRAMDAHLAHVRAHRAQIHFADPLLSDDGATPIGTMCIIDVDDRAAAEAYIAADPYNQAGLLEEPEIRRFVSSKRLRHGDRAPDPNLQMFVAECIDGPDVVEKRKATAAAHHAYQGSIHDRYIAHGPLRGDDGIDLEGSLFLIEVADRAAAEELVGNEPMTAAGVFAEVRINRWRYGTSLG